MHTETILFPKGTQVSYFQFRRYSNNDNQLDFTDERLIVQAANLPEASDKLAIRISGSVIGRSAIVVFPNTKNGGYIPIEDHLKGYQLFDNFGNNEGPYNSFDYAVERARKYMSGFMQLEKVEVKQREAEPVENWIVVATLARRKDGHVIIENMVD